MEPSTDESEAISELCVLANQQDLLPEIIKRGLKYGEVLVLLRKLNGQLDSDTIH